MERFIEGPDISDNCDESKSDGHGPLPTNKVEVAQDQQSTAKDQLPAGDSQAF